MAHDENVDNPDWMMGMVFENIDQFRLAIKKYIIAQGRPIKFKRNKSRRLKVLCKENYQ